VYLTLEMQLGSVSHLGVANWWCISPWSCKLVVYLTLELQLGGVSHLGVATPGCIIHQGAHFQTLEGSHKAMYSTYSTIYFLFLFLFG